MWRNLSIPPQKTNECLFSSIEIYQITKPCRQLPNKANINPMFSISIFLGTKMSVSNKIILFLNMISLSQEFTKSLHFGCNGQILQKNHKNHN